MALLALGAAGFVAAAALAQGARIVAGGIILTGDGSFRPNALPRKAFAPITLRAHAKIRTTDGAPPPRLASVVLLFDRNGHLDTRGLATCPLGRVANLTVPQARKACRKAIVGKGTGGGVIDLDNAPPVRVSSPVTIFNGPRQGGDATAVIHSFIPYPTPTTYAFSARIARVHKGPFGYQVTADLPPIASGAGTITRVNGMIKKRYTFKGRSHSYVSARCPNGVLVARGKFTFSDGTVLAGSIYKGCLTKTRKTRR